MTERPNKKLKTIIINISHEALEDLPNVSPAKQVEYFEKISSYLQQRLSILTLSIVLLTVNQHLLKHG